MAKVLQVRSGYGSRDVGPQRVDEGFVEQEVVELRVNLLAFGRIDLAGGGLDQLGVRVTEIAAIVAAVVRRRARGELGQRLQVCPWVGGEVQPVRLGMPCIQQRGGLERADDAVHPNLGEVRLIDLRLLSGCRGDRGVQQVNIEVADACLLQQRPGLVEVERDKVVLLRL